MGWMGGPAPSGTGLGSELRSLALSSVPPRHHSTHFDTLDTLEIHAASLQPFTMAVVSAYFIIRSLALFHITLAVFFLKSPETIASQNIVFMMGQSMKLVRTICPTAWSSC